MLNNQEIKLYIENGGHVLFFPSLYDSNDVYIEILNSSISIDREHIRLSKENVINSDIFRIIAGIIIIFFSLQLIGIINLKFMNKDIRIFTDQYSNNMTFPLLVGAAFGFGWTPCIGPILGSILTLAALEENIGKGILLLSFYSLGLAIPFIISGILIDKFLLFSKGFKKYTSAITKTGGIILLLTGIAILTGQLQVLGFFILEYFPLLGNIG